MKYGMGSIMKGKIENIINKTTNRIKEIIVGFIIVLGLTDWVKRRLMTKWLGAGNSTVFAYHVWLIITPVVGFIMLTAYIYDEMKGYYKIHVESSRVNPDPFWMMQKPGMENNILSFVALLIANAIVTSIILLWF